MSKRLSNYFTVTADVTDIETAMEYKPGLWWGVMGPSTLLHLGGGTSGAESYASKFLPHFMSWYADRDPDKWIREMTTAAENN
jgi:3-hydroxyacyl-CoA dehydrogenase